jgi:hypothetical protein
MDDKRPRTLYKYQPYSRYALENLLKGQLFFPKPEQLNDPLDCQPSWEPLEMSDIEWKLAHKIMRGKCVDKDSFDKEFTSETEPNDFFKRHIIEESTQKHYPNKVKEYHEYQIACFSPEKDNSLMWAHYADGHRGFCLGFDTGYPPFEVDGYNKICQVKYPPQPVIRFSILDVILQRDTPLIDLMTTKSKPWSYEKEWRILRYPNDPSEFCYEKAALIGIYFGQKMKPYHKSNISRFLDYHHYSTHQYEMVYEAGSLVARPYRHNPEKRDNEPANSDLIIK